MKSILLVHCFDVTQAPRKLTSTCRHAVHICWMKEIYDAMNIMWAERNMKIGWGWEWWNSWILCIRFRRHLNVGERLIFITCNNYTQFWATVWYLITCCGIYWSNQGNKCYYLFIISLSLEPLSSFLQVLHKIYNQLLWNSV
jgi:hypothetical protein